MRIGKQLSIFLENKPGALAEVCEALADDNVNILALAVSDTVDHAVVRLVVDDPRKALHIMGQAGLLVVENEVLIAEVPNRPGTLAAVAGAMAEADLNIEYAYCTAGDDQADGVLVLRTRRPRAALNVLNEEPAEPEGAG
jgi:hypothetical protein